MKQVKFNRVLPRECTSHSKHSLLTTQEKTLHRDIPRWSTPKSDWLYSLQPKMEKLYTVNKNKTRSWLWLRSWTPYCQIHTKLEKVGKTTRPFSPVQFSRSVMSDSLRPHESQHTRPPCPSPTPGVHSDSRPSSQWCHPAISSCLPLLLLPPIPPSIRVFSTFFNLSLNLAIRSSWSVPQSTPGLVFVDCIELFHLCKY